MANGGERQVRKGSPGAEEESLRHVTAPATASPNAPAHAGQLNAPNLLRMQRVVGNRAVVRLLSRQGTPSPAPLQRSRAVVQRFTDADAQKRAYEIWEKKGRKPNQTKDEQDRDYSEASDQLRQEMLDRLRAGLASPTTLAAIRPIYITASAADRTSLWKDAALMSAAKTNLSTEDWLRFVADVGVYREGGTVAHATAKTADNKIREMFKDYVGDAVANGKSVEGQVVVLEGEEWEKAYYHEFPDELPKGGPTDDEPTTNAFTTTSPPKDVIVLNKNKGNPGTTIHEGMHLYQHDNCLNLGSSFQEGLTEWLTRGVTTLMGIPRANYETNYDAVVPFVAAVGEDAVKKAYFKGETEALRIKFIDFRKGKGSAQAVAEGEWTALLTAFKAKQWATAKALAT